MVAYPPVSKRILALWIFLIGILAASVCGGQAAPARNSFKVATWSGGAYYDSQTKAFDRCTATNPSAKGVDISYSVDRQFHWAITLSNPGWNFTKGTSRGVYVRVGDTTETIIANAVATERSVLELQTKDPLLFFAKLRIARQLRVVMGGLLLESPLDGGEEVLSALTHCVLRATRSYQNPKSSGSIFDSDEIAPTPDTQKEAAALVSNIISEARIAGSQVLPKSDGFSYLPVAVAWKAGLIIAGVTIVAPPLPSERLVEGLVARALHACRGGFFFVSMPDVINTLSITRVFASCQTAETTRSSFHLVIPRPKKGSYLLTVESTGSSFINNAHQFANAYETRLRAVIVEAINKL